jgi:hypothetical protein
MAKAVIYYGLSRSITVGQKWIRKDTSIEYNEDVVTEV